MKRMRDLGTVFRALTGAMLLLVLTNCGGGEAPAQQIEGVSLVISNTARTETGTMTVRSYEELAATQNDAVQPRTGLIFAVIELEGCMSKTKSGTITIYANDVHLLLTDDTLLNPTRAVREPALQQITNVRSGTCARGFLTYGVPSDSQATFVIYEVVPRPQLAGEQDIVTIRWAIP